jgi:hypothetical protein
LEVDQLDKEYSKILKYGFLIHFIVAIAFGLGYFFVPDTLLDFFEWPVQDLYVVRVLGAAFIGISSSSILGYLTTSWDNVKIIVQMELVWLIFGILGAFWSLLGAVEYPLFAIIAPLLLIGFLIAFGYSYYLEEFQ